MLIYGKINYTRILILIKNKQTNKQTGRPDVFEQELFDNDVPELAKVDVVELPLELDVVEIDERGLDLLAGVEGDLLAVGLYARVEKSQVAFLLGHVGGHLAELGREETHESARRNHDPEADRGRQRVVKVARLGHRDERVRDEHDVEQWLRHLRVEMHEQLHELVHVLGHVLVHLSRLRLFYGDLVVHSILEVVFVSPYLLTFRTYINIYLYINSYHKQPEFFFIF